MFVRNWGKSLFCVLLVCVVFLSLSFSFAAEDMDLSLEDNYEDNVDLSDSNDEVCSDLKCASDSDENVLEDDGDGGDDGAFNEDDSWVENLEEDSHDEEFEFISGFEPGIGPGMNPMDNRASTKLVVSSFSKYYRNGTQLVGYLQDASNNPLVGKTVQINIANANYTRTTDENGGFRLNINLKPNNYTSAISFAGDSNYKPSSKTITVKVFTMPTSITSSNLVKYYRNASQLVAQLKDVHGNPLVGKNITITILGNVYQRATDDDGYIHMNINMHPRVCNATLNFTENGYVSSKKVVSITVLEMPTSIVSSNLVKYYRNGSYWVARLLDGNGNPLAGKTLTFNIDTHTYTRVSDDDGYCYIIINLRPGTFTGTASFSEQYYTSSSKTISVNVLDPPIPIVNLDSGIYNDSSLLVNFSAYLENVTVFCSFDNGSTWYEGLGELSFNVSAGNWSVLSYVGLNGHNSSVISRNFVVDYSAPFVWASNGSAIYNESFYVDLYALDDADGNPLIYYTLDGSLPNENSTVFNESIYIDDSSNLTTLRFVSVDFMGRSSGVVNVFYFFGDLVANLNSGKCFETVQGAIDDNDTFEGDIIEVSKDLNENIIMNKSVYLRSCDFKDVLWEIEDDLSCVVFDSVVGAIVEGFAFKSNASSCIVFDNSSDCFVVDNLFFSNGYNAIRDYCDFDNLSSYKDVSFGNYILHNSFYGGYVCIDLVHCLNYSFIGNDFNEDNVSLMDHFNVSYNNFAHNVGILAHESANSLFERNCFYNMDVMGVCLLDGLNDSFINNSFSQCNVSVDINGNYVSLRNNNFSNNNFGIVIEGVNNSVISNFIMNNDFGVFSENSSDFCVNFNRMVNNNEFGLYVVDGSVNATNNWWGSNIISAGTSAGCDVYYSNNFDIIYEPYLVLNIYVSSFRKNQLETNIYYGDEIIMNYSLSDAVCVADLRRNNLGEDVSYLGTIPDDTILFVRYVPFVQGHRVSLISGLGIFSTPKGIGDGVVLIYFDDEYQILNLNDVEDVTKFYFKTSGVILDTNSSFRSYTAHLNSNVAWVTFIWKYVGNLNTEFNLILDGNVVDNFTVESSFYHENMNNYSSNVWQAMELYNDFLFNELSNSYAWVYVCIALDYGLITFSSVENKYDDGTWRDYPYELKMNLTDNGVLFNTTLLSLIKDKYNLTDDEINFIYDNHLNIRDFIKVSFAYLGSEREVFNFDLGNSTESYIFTGSSSARYAEISCVNGAYAHMVGNNATDYEESWTNIHNQNGTVDWVSGYSYGYYANAWYDGLMTFTFANDKVDNGVLGYWLNQSNRTDSNGSLVFDVGPMKAAYGSFLEGLLVIYVDDLVADAAAERYNVTWNRISPMVMSVHDNVLETYMTGECDFYFGREAYGSLDNVKAFYIACSSSFSLIERYVGENLFPGIGDLSGVTTGLGYILENNGTLEIFIQDGCVLIREEGSNERVLIFDSETGLLHDAYYDLNGAFCYSNQQTDWALALGSELLNSYGDIWSYLLGNGDLPNLSPPTANMVKSCNFFLGVGGLFMLEGVEYGTYLASLGTACGDILAGAFGPISLGIIAAISFIYMPAVGEPDGYVDNYWDSHYSPDDSYVVFPDDDLVQIKNHNLIKEYKKIQNGEDIPVNGDLSYLNGADGSPENLLKALAAISAFTGLLIVNDISSSYPKGYYYPNNVSNVTYYSNYTLQLNYTQSDGKMTLTRV
ncbi:chitobiase/beta-hexosaminidase C-terminal domain-containing protein [Methanobrevibacter sp.]